MADMDGIHHKYISRSNAMAERFEAAASLQAELYGKAVETRLTQLLGLMDSVPGNPYRSPQVRAAMVDFFADVEKLGLDLFGPGSVFEGQTKTVMASMARNGMDRLMAQFQAQRFVLKQNILDSGAIMDAAQDAYSLAARNLGTVAPLRQLMTQELIQGNGTAALTHKLVEAGFIKDLKKGKRVYKAVHRARMMARTEPVRLQELAYQDATREVAPIMSKRLYRWVSVLAPTSTQDSFDRHGHIMTKMEWETHRWPNDNYQGTPPLRPNDRCSVIFYLPEWLNKKASKAMGLPPGSAGRRLLNPGQAKLLKYREKNEGG